MSGQEPDKPWAGRIYTRRGDSGDTSLLRGGRVAKDTPRTHAYGTVDEAVSALGLARAELDGEMRNRVLAVQRELFVLGAQLATAPDRWDTLETGVSRVDDTMINELEQRIDAVVEASPLPRGFMVPGEDRASAALDLARTVVRRAERLVVTMTRDGLLPDEAPLRYLNRLSDYVYVLARAVEGRHTPSRGNPAG